MVLWFGCFIYFLSSLLSNRNGGHNLHLCVGIVNIWPMIKKKILTSSFGHGRFRNCYVDCALCSRIFFWGISSSKSVGWALSIMDATEEYLDEQYEVEEETEEEIFVLI
jgi:hypothetical protein